MPIAWLTARRPTGQLASLACRPPQLGCLATPTVLLGCLTTLVTAAAQGLLMKLPDRPLPFKTWKLTDHRSGTSGNLKTFLCEAKKKKKLHLTSAAVKSHRHTLRLCTRNAAELPAYNAQTEFSHSCKKKKRISSRSPCT